MNTRKKKEAKPRIRIYTKDGCKVTTDNRMAFYLASASGNLNLNQQVMVLGNELFRRGYVKAPRRIDIYEDKHQSGLHPGREFERMCNDIKDGKIGVVMLDRMNPLLNTLNDMLSFHKFVEIKEIRFITANDNIASIHWHCTCEQCTGGAR